MGLGPNFQISMYCNSREPEMIINIYCQWRMQDLGGGGGGGGGGGVPQGIPTHSARGYSIGVWGGGPAALQLSQFLSHKT